MKYLFVVDDYLPHSIKVAAIMMHELALEFIKNGHQVTVLTPNPFQKETYKITLIDNVEVVNFKSGQIKNIGKIKRAVNETLLSLNALINCNLFFEQSKFDGIVYYSPTIFFGHLVGKLKKKFNCKAYLILRDIFPQWTLDNGLVKKNSIIYLYFRFWENLNYKSADKIGVMSPSNLSYFNNRFKDITNFEVFFNWSDNINIPIPIDKYRTELNLQNKIVLFYGGNIGHAQQMINLVNLAKKLKDYQNVHFLFVGRGDEVELIKNEVKTNQLKNITYLPSVNQNEYFRMLNEFDIGLFTLHPDHKTHNFPGKLLGYMNYSKPILGCVNKGNDLMEIVNDANAGFVVESTDSQQLYKYALKLIQSEELRLSMGKNGKNLLKNQFSVKEAYSKIIDLFK